MNENLTPKRRPLFLGIIIWLILILIYFAPTVFEGKVLAPLDLLDCLFKPYATQPMEQIQNHFTVDAISQYLPYNDSVAKSIAEDGYVGWNPMTHSGSAISENTMLCPGDWHFLLYFILPFWSSWDWGIILQFFIAGLGMLLLLRQQQIPIPYNLIGAVGYGFYSQFVVWIYHRWVLGAMCWAPLLAWAILRNKGKRIIDIPTILFMALAIRGGHLQACMFVFLFVVCFCLYEWWIAPQRFRLSTICKVILPYFVSGLGAMLLSVDVLMQTIPALLEGCKKMPIQWGLTHLPTLITSFFPTILGVPETLDFFKVMGQDLFDLKFIGATILVLGIIGFFNKQAPLAAKFLTVISLIAVFTPLMTYFYSRSTVIFALGIAWLAAWQLYTCSRQDPSLLWGKIFRYLLIISILWLLVSVGISLFYDNILSQLQTAITSKLTPAEMGRKYWYLIRCGRFLDQTLIWHPRTLSFLLLFLAGIWGCSHIHNRSKYVLLWVSFVVALSFGEHMLYRSVWVHFSDKPSETTLYEEKEWITHLKEQIKDGSVVIISTADRDYLLQNHLSSFGIIQAEGYETVQPRKIQGTKSIREYPEEADLAGISHILVNPKDKNNVILPKWTLVEETPQYILYANPYYRGKYLASQEGQDIRALAPEQRTCNRIRLKVPAGTTQVLIRESYSRGWSATLNDRQALDVRKTEQNGIVVDIPESRQDSVLLLQYRDYRQPTYTVIMIGTLLLIALYGCFRFLRERSASRTS